MSRPQRPSAGKRSNDTTSRLSANRARSRQPSSEGQFLLRLRLCLCLSSLDVPFVLELGREYYINNPGANYIVRRTDSGWITKIEIQSAANPLNAAALVEGIATFRPQWFAGEASTYRFDTDAAE